MPQYNSHNVLSADLVTTMTASELALALSIGPYHASDLYVTDRLESALVAWISRSLEDCWFVDLDGGEHDCREHVFRVLGAMKAWSALPPIETYLAQAKWPNEAIFEAALAYWCISGSQRYLAIIERAVYTSLACRARHALDEMAAADLPGPLLAVMLD